MSLINNALEDIAGILRTTPNIRSTSRGGQSVNQPLKNILDYEKGNETEDYLLDGGRVVGNTYGSCYNMVIV